MGYARRAHLYTREHANGASSAHEVHAGRMRGTHEMRTEWTINAQSAHPGHERCTRETHQARARRAHIAQKAHKTRKERKPTRKGTHKTLTKHTQGAGNPHARGSRCTHRPSVSPTGHMGVPTRGAHRYAQEARGALANTQGGREMRPANAQVAGGAHEAHSRCMQG